MRAGSSPRNWLNKSTLVSGKKLKLGPNDRSKELEVRRLHHVLKAARKRQRGKKNTEKAMEGVGSTMDNLETLPLLPPDLIEEIWQDRGWV